MLSGVQSQRARSRLRKNDELPHYSVWVNFLLLLLSIPHALVARPDCIQTRLLCPHLCFAPLVHPGTPPPLVSPRHDDQSPRRIGRSPQRWPDASRPIKLLSMHTCTDCVPCTTGPLLHPRCSRHRACGVNRKEIPFPSEDSEAKILLSKVKGQYYATSSKCTHYGAPLAKGVLTAEGRLVWWVLS